MVSSRIASSRVHKARLSSLRKQIGKFELYKSRKVSLSSDRVSRVALLEKYGLRYLTIFLKSKNDIITFLLQAATADPLYDESKILVRFLDYSIKYILDESSRLCDVFIG